ncbi:MAG TPA: DUF1501 domain-containing protein [Pirellulaceae bacterium]|nr:DUF1501 domain-containing protein [Pirellulaceae bacterium]
MLNFALPGPARRLCNGLDRRQLLRLGAASLFPALTLPRLLESEALGAAHRGKAKSCIFIFLEGGPPQQDMWDPKPDAPSEIRGPFNPIATSVPGTIFTEHCRNCAQIAHKFTVVRSHTHNDNGHATGYHYVMTGRRPPFPDGEHPIPTNELYPSLGSVVARELGSGGALPAYINMPHPMSAGGPGFYGAEFAPFVIEADPSQPDFEVKDLGQVEGISNSRQSRRQKLLAGLEQQRAKAGRAAAMSTYYSKAYDLITSPAARKAFDIHSESDKTRESYGKHQIGQCALLGRRLIEAGCRFVGIDAPGWDVHFNCFPSLQGDLIPPADQAFAALITDLEQRGLLDSTLVVMMGEMGRTPRVNAQAGRDHWSMAQCILFAGGGVKPGQIIGETDRQAAAPTRDPVSVADLLHTVHSIMGIDSRKTYADPLGRPVPIVDGGQLIPGLLS